jgi:hypothetical protein
MQKIFIVFLFKSNHELQMSLRDRSSIADLFLRPILFSSQGKPARMCGF